MRRSQSRITSDQLKLLAAVAEQACQEFFAKRSAARIYKDRFIAAALCQGAALHFLGLGTGVKDFDLHLFYVQHPARKQIARTVRRIRTKIPGFGERMVDIIWTVVPTRVAKGKRNNPVRAIQDFLVTRPTKNARYVAQKAVIGLLPDRLRGRVIWPRLPLELDGGS